MQLILVNLRGQKIPLFALAIPVLHSSGAWIAYAGTGYLAGTLSSTWIGAFVLGNASWLAGAGLISSAAIASATGVLSGIGAGAASAIGVGLSSVGLGGVASWLGVAPVTTFLGLTPVGWAVAGSVTAVVGIGTVLTRSTIKRINIEREKGGLQPTSLLQIIREVRQFEADSMLRVLKQIANENSDVKLSEDQTSATFSGVAYSLTRLRYIVNEDGSEEIVFVTRAGERKRVFLVCGPTGDPSLV
ncbi:hypothetical protein [Ruegeria lacuscaerulensis]|uniref:hypothetical protein n=1 Tax=Ruegeria lacuscaerulensis TaxID=55218 RepID=UPI001480FBC9|nr:hypothetical protein [Ruegeria lacuscaerulensis]